MLQYPFDAALVLQKKRALKKELLAIEGLTEKKIAIVSGTTVGDVKPVLELFLLNLGIKPLFYEGEYGLFYEDVVFDTGGLSAFGPDILYIHTSNHNLRAWPDPADTPEDTEKKLEAEYARFEAVWQAAKKLGCPILQNNFEAPAFRNFGNMDAWDTRGRVSFVRRLNEKLAGYARANPGFYIHDLDYLSALYGLESWCDAAAWYGYKYACAPAHIPHLCHSLAHLIGAVFGRTKKAVVTDLDNTLWGGVIGDDGPEGIELGHETPAGMAFSDYGGYLSMLSRRGILLTAASKNEEAIALSGLARPESPLKREDFLVFEANWNPKSQSVAQIAKTLNIGTDSLVFTDDNPAEREEVQRALPEVEAPAFGAPEQSISLLDRAGYFETVSLSADDAARVEMYRQNASRQQQQQSFENYEDYLKSLEMGAEIRPFSPQHLERITQLINKTNQFNLTTRRYTAAQVQAITASPDYMTLSARLWDKFGDNGITAALIGHIEGDTLTIDLWVMSCRVFKRQLEQATFDTLVPAAKSRGIKTIRGQWLPTAKNLLVKDFYATIGFSLTSESDTQRSFSYTVPEMYSNQNTAIKVEE